MRWNIRTQRETDGTEPIHRTGYTEPAAYLTISHQSFSAQRLRLGDLGRGPEPALVRPVAASSLDSLSTVRSSIGCFAARRSMEEILGTYGWDDHWSALFARFADGDVQPGRIVRQDRAAPLVATSLGLVHLPVRRNVGALTVGDWVVVEDGEVIVDLLDRSSLLRRHDPEADQQLLAANVDVVAMVFGPDRPLKAGRVFRTRTQIWDAGAVPLVVLTKTDLVEDDSGIDALIGRVHEIDPLLDVVAVSCVTGAGLDALRRHVDGRTLALVGESGAGKSTLVNALVGRRGRDPCRPFEPPTTGVVTRPPHESCTRYLAEACSSTRPGCARSASGPTSRAVDSVFPEIEEHALACRYRDCTHGPEPGCAVQAAVAGGLVSAERFAAWESLRQEAAAAALRADKHGRACRRTPFWPGRQELQAFQERRLTTGSAATPLRCSRRGPMPHLRSRSLRCHRRPRCAEVPHRPGVRGPLGTPPGTRLGP